MEVRPDRQVSLSIRWLITYARSRGEKGMSNKLAAELLDAFNSRGGIYRCGSVLHPRLPSASAALSSVRVFHLSLRLCPPSASSICLCVPISRPHLPHFLRTYAHIRIHPHASAYIPPIKCFPAPQYAKTT